MSQQIVLWFLVIGAGEILMLITLMRALLYLFIPVGRDSKQASSITPAQTSKGAALVLAVLLLMLLLLYKRALSFLLPWQTTKERHMWTCPFHPPIQLYFIIRNTERSPEFGISRIKIWNYNRSLNVCFLFFKSISICFFFVCVHAPVYKMPYCEMTVVQHECHLFQTPLDLSLSGDQVVHFHVCGKLINPTSLSTVSNILYWASVLAWLRHGVWFSLSSGWLSCQSVCPNVEQ